MCAVATKSKKLAQILREREKVSGKSGLTSRELCRIRMHKKSVPEKKEPTSREVLNTYFLLNHMNHLGNVKKREGKQSERPTKKSGKFYVWTLTPSGRRWVDYVTKRDGG